MNAVNHAGWNVEFLSIEDGRGWVALVGPLAEKSEANQYRIAMQETMPNTEFRVYEALK